jgi:hypothetical protein
MYIDSMTITAIVVFAIAMGIFVKKCFIHSCILKADEKAGISHDVESGSDK